MLWPLSATSVTHEKGCDLMLRWSSVESPATSCRVQRPVVVGAWCFIIIGVGHLAITGMSSLRPASRPVQSALDAMHAAPVTLLGMTRDLATVHQGFSTLMALLGIGYGVFNLAVHRLAPEAFDRGTGLLWINFAVAAAGLIVAVIAFPPPPILALAVAVAAFARGLLVARRPLS